MATRRNLTVGVLALVVLAGCGAPAVERTSATGASSATAATSVTVATPTGSATTPAAAPTASGTAPAATPATTTIMAVGVPLTLDSPDVEGLLRVLTVSRSCSTPDALQVLFKAGELTRRQVRLLVVDGAGRVLRSSARPLQLTDRAPGGDGGVPFYGLRDTLTVRQVAGGVLGSPRSSGWRAVLVNADSTRALAHSTPVVVPSCAEGVWHAPSPTLEVTDVRRDCAAEPATSESFTTRVRASGLVYGQGYSIDGGATGNDLNNVPRTMAETYDGPMDFSPGVDRRPSPNGVAAPFPRTAFDVTVRLAASGPDGGWFERRDESSAPVTVHVPAC